MKAIPPALEVGERELILVTYNECIFYSNNEKRGIWVSDEKMPLWKKGNGRSIMVSEFFLEACSQLRLSEEEATLHPNVPVEVHCYLMPSKNQEGYWTVE